MVFSCVTPLGARALVKVRAHAIDQLRPLLAEPALPVAVAGLALIALWCWRELRERRKPGD